KEKFSIDAAAEKGRKLPEWYLNEPVLSPGEDFYLKAFRDLTTCRSYSVSLGPIPWRDILLYAEYSGLEEDVIEPFIFIIRHMDDAYLKWSDSENERDKPKAKKAKK